MSLGGAGSAGATGFWSWPGPPPPTPASPHIGPGAPSVPQPGPPPANSRRTPRARAGDGGLEGSPTITAAASPALALGLPLFLLPFALGRRHHRFYFRPRRGSSGIPVPPQAGCGVIHALPSCAAPLPHPLKPKKGNKPKEPDVGN